MTSFSFPAKYDVALICQAFFRFSLLFTRSQAFPRPWASDLEIKRGGKRSIQSAKALDANWSAENKRPVTRKQFDLKTHLSVSKYAALFDALTIVTETGS